MTFTNELLDDLQNICLGHLHKPSQMQHHVISQEKMNSEGKFLNILRILNQGKPVL